MIRPTRNPAASTGPKDPALAARVSRNLPRCRINAGLSPLELAKKARLDYRTVRRAERGESSPQFSTLRVLARALGCGVADLVRDP